MRTGGSWPYGRPWSPHDHRAPREEAILDITVTPSPLAGLVVVTIEPVRDDRGLLVETYHRERWREAGIWLDFVQENRSRSARGVLRGFHWQDMSAPQAKLVRCSSGAILDVALDLRDGSPTFGQTFAVELTGDNCTQLLVPVGFGHAFLVLSEVAEVEYRCDGYYLPGAEHTLAWDDPDVAFDWPEKSPTLSDRDRKGMSLRQYGAAPMFMYGPS